MREWFILRWASRAARDMVPGFLPRRLGGGGWGMASLSLSSSSSSSGCDGEGDDTDSGGSGPESARRRFARRGGLHEAA